MDPNIVLMMDRMTDGKFSEIHAKYKALVRKNKAIREEIKAKDKALKEVAKTKAKVLKEVAKAKDKALREEAKAKDKALKAKDSENARLKKDAILALRADNKSVEEISAKLKLSLADVGQILDNAMKKGK
ncbi:MAG: hypothetical protein LBO66_03145 [Deltaproteobacteria bacterium]|jgi:uncharacterized iron-regulated protein|nr:hypothetical protein [Deltaproteobacteria bacterium]